MGYETKCGTIVSKAASIKSYSTHPATRSFPNATNGGNIGEYHAQERARTKAGEGGQIDGGIVWRVYYCDTMCFCYNQHL